ncbi:MAG TPA: hypothetical protein EYP04_01100 [Anaerolineae bacterium]|nr:hypothetical protein [Anaerolineae bacterium]
MERRLGRGTIHNVTPLDDERVLVVATGGAALFNLGDGTARWELDCPAGCGALSPDGRLLALGSGEDILVWDVGEGRLVRRLTGHSMGVRSVAFSPDGRLLASGSGDKTVKLPKSTPSPIRNTGPAAAWFRYSF